MILLLALTNSEALFLSWNICSINQSINERLIDSLILQSTFIRFFTPLTFVIETAAKLVAIIAWRRKRRQVRFVGFQLCEFASIWNQIYQYSLTNDF